VRKKLVILAGLGFLVVSVGAALSWHEIMTRYHLQRLRKDPEHLGKIVHEPEGSSAQAALHEYLESTEGKSALVRDIVPDLVANELVKLKANRTALCLHASGNAIIVLDFAKDTIRNYYIQSHWRWLQLCRQFLVNDDYYRIAGYPDIRVQFLNAPPVGAERYCK